MDTLSSTSKVFVWFFHPQNSQRVWVSGVENTFDKKLNRLILVPKLDDSPERASAFAYEYAVKMRERFSEELPAVYVAHFSLDPTGQEVGASFVRSPGDDTRVPMAYRGLIAVPGTHVQRGHCWYVRFPNSSIESICGDTVEDAVNRVFDMQLQDRAEKAPPPPAPELPKETRNPGPRQRPGDRY
jgi:hypothetical protein